MEKTLKESWLVQRLQKPRKFDNPFSFGGGLKNGGISSEAMGILRGIFSFDYMGSSEFEWGAIPEAFDKIAKNIKSYTTYETSINKIPVYIIGDSELKEETIKRVQDFAKNKLQLKERTGFPHALGLDKWAKDYENRNFGWLELDNGFMFFTDEVMFSQTAELFGLKNEFSHSSS